MSNTGIQVAWMAGAGKGHVKIMLLSIEQKALGRIPQQGSAEAVKAAVEELQKDGL